ncbi:lytic transglycosylase domain-containing protein [Mesorhizobium kowhaii]|uniref:Lytic transglycosylase n=1 Tax=Mesorhizobium kowhaii TaxID=1300272 RepID=A0A2W7CB22_9HYPH|nr:lytic transglycosylase domain-containing protein [Mesorhizobium kowhaii]PZV40490.1 lytic transglycosylase [Mesorhizobium kowhaii]
MSARRRSPNHLAPSALLRVGRRNACVLLARLCLACAIPAIAQAQGPMVGTPSARNYEAHIAEAARRFRLPLAWIRAVLVAESAGDRRATSRKGAMGLMQIVPETWSELRIRYGLGSDPYDPHDNIIAGSAYIRELLDRYGSPGWIAAYNAGPGRYEESLQGRRLPRETRAYVTAVSSAIGGDTATRATGQARPASSGWRKAPLFVVQPQGKPAADSPPVEDPRDGVPRAQAVRDPSNVAPRSAGLFVAKADDRTEP